MLKLNVGEKLSTKPSIKKVTPTSPTNSAMSTNQTTQSESPPPQVQQVSEFVELIDHSEIEIFHSSKRRTQFHKQKTAIAYKFHSYKKNEYTRKPIRFSNSFR